MSIFQKKCLNTRQFLMGNQAIVRGALEAGVQFAAGYPGTPSSEIVQNMAEAAKTLNVYAEWSINEKVATEVAYGAAVKGHLSAGRGPTKQPGQHGTQAVEVDQPKYKVKGRQMPPGAPVVEVGASQVHIVRTVLLLGRVWKTRRHGPTERQVWA